MSSQAQEQPQENEQAPKPDMVEQFTNLAETFSPEQLDAFKKALSLVEEKRGAKEEAPAPAEVQTVEKADLSIIPPQTRDRMHTIQKFDDKDIQAMSGSETGAEAIGRVSIEAAKKVGNIVGDWLPTSALGRLGTKLQVQGIELLSAPKQAALEEMYKWRSNRTEAARAEKATAEGEVNTWLARLAEADRSAEVARGGSSGIYDATLSAKIEHERHSLVNKLGQAKAVLNKAQVKYEYRHNKVVYWENKSNNLAERVAAKIEKVSLPSQAEFEVQKQRQTHIADKLASLKRARDMGHEGLIDLKTRLKNNPTEIENVDIHTTMEAVEDCLARITKEFDETTAKSEAIASKMNKLNFKIGIAEIAQNRQMEKTQADRHYEEPKVQDSVERGDNKEHSFSHVPDAKEEAPEQEEPVKVEVKHEEKPTEAEAVSSAVEEKKQEPATIPEHAPEPPAAPAVVPIEKPKLQDDGTYAIAIQDLSDPTDNEPKPLQAPGKHDTVLKIEQLKSEPTQKMPEHMELDGQKYLDTWNKKWGNEMTLDGQEIYAKRPTGVPWEHLSVDEVEKVIKAALQKKAGNNRTFYAKDNTQVIYNDEAIDHHLKEVRAAYMVSYPPNRPATAA